MDNLFFDEQNENGKSITKINIKKYIEKKEDMQKKARQKFPLESKEHCKSGQIMREGYYIKSRKGHTKSGKEINVKEHWVSPGCINSPLGRNTKGEKIITIMEKDILKPFGYENIKNITTSERQKALKKAIKTLEPLSVYRRIIAIATLNKNKDEDLYKILRYDAKWIKSQSEYINQKASKKTSKKASKKVSKKTSKKTSKK